MDSQLEVLLTKLKPGERLAVELVKTALDIYNQADGTGLFKGMARYNVLAARLEIAAVQARSPLELWGLIMRRLQWPPPAQSHDAAILALLARPEAADMISVLATNARSIVMIARFWHVAERPSTKRKTEQVKEGETLFD